MFVADVCGEGKKEILVVKNNYLKTTSAASASLYELEDAKLKKIDETQVIASVQEYKSFQIQKINSKSVFFLDGIIDKQNMITEILYWDDNKGHLLNPIYDSDEGIPTYRTGNTVVCTDINLDGIIEIPFMLQSIDEKFVPLTEWKQFEIDGFRSVNQGVCSDDLIFNFPESWKNQIAVKRDGNVWTFYDESGEENVKLFELLACDISEFSQLNSDDNAGKDYEIVKIDYGTAYGVRFSSDDSPFSLNKNEIKDAIINIR